MSTCGLEGYAFFCTKYAAPTVAHIYHGKRHGLATKGGTPASLQLHSLQIAEQAMVTSLITIKLHQSAPQKTASLHPPHQGSKLGGAWGLVGDTILREKGG